jgi:hypothetical protein
VGDFKAAPSAAMLQTDTHSSMRACGNILNFQPSRCTVMFPDYQECYQLHDMRGCSGCAHATPTCPRPEACKPGVAPTSSCRISSQRLISSTLCLCSGAAACPSPSPSYAAVTAGPPRPPTTPSSWSAAAESGGSRGQGSRRQCDWNRCT